MVARIAGLEMLSMSTLATLLAFSGNDPDLSRTKALLETLRSHIDPYVAGLPPDVAIEARKYLSNLLNDALTHTISLKRLAGQPAGRTKSP